MVVPFENRLRSPPDSPEMMTYEDRHERLVKLALDERVLE